MIFRPLIFVSYFPLTDRWFVNFWEFICAFGYDGNGTERKGGDCVLDLCCGSGDLAFLLSEKVDSGGKVCSALTS